MNTPFWDRHQAGQILAQQLPPWLKAESGVVLALPRGGVPVGYEIASPLRWPLQVWLVRKLGVPNQPELAMGAIAFPNTQVLNTQLIRKLHISDAQVDTVIQAEEQELQRRYHHYCQTRQPPALGGKPVIIVDDGLATGATMQGAITAIRAYHPASVTVAVPIAAASSLRSIQPQVDHIVCPVTPEHMGAISQWYVHFEPVADTEVIALLEQARLNLRL